jgi:hypothetical protein
MSLYIKEATLESKTRSNTATAVVSCVLFELLTLVAVRTKKSEFTTANGASCSNSDRDGMEAAVSLWLGKRGCNVLGGRASIAMPSM